MAIPSPLDILCPYINISQFMCTQGGGRQFSPIYLDISDTVGGGCRWRGAWTVTPSCILYNFSQVDKKLMAKLKDEEALGDTRERIGFL